MPANKKKKKPASNPARGFATVSQPSKVKEAKEDVDSTDAESTVLPVKDVSKPGSTLPQGSAQAGSNNIQEMTPAELEAHLEESELVNFVEKHGARCKQDVSRQISRLETERRQLRSPTQSHRLATASWYSTDAMDSLLSLHADALSKNVSGEMPGSSTLNEEVLLLSLWTLKRTLTALKLPDVDDAIRNVLKLHLSGRVASSDYIWGLAETFEWYAVRSKMYNLSGYEDVAAMPSQQDVGNAGKEANQSESEHVTIVCKMMVSLKGNDIPCMPPSKSIHFLELLDNTVPFYTKPKSQSANFVPDSQQPASKQRSEHEVNDLGLAESDGADDVELSDLPSSGSDDDDPAFFTERYCRLQTSLFRTEQKLKQWKSPKALSRKQVLLGKINKLTRDPLFDEYLAKSQWQPRLQDLEIEAARALQESQRSARSKLAASTDNGDDSDEDVLSGMFAGTDEETLEQASDTSHTVQCVDFGSWSGAQPRRILEDTCNAIQPGASLRFFNISSSSFSVRQGMEVKLSNNTLTTDRASIALPESLKLTIINQVIKLEMMSISTKTPIQAESYLSTVMLFLLSTTRLSDQKHHSRLPTVWRNIYQQLIDEQKEAAIREDVAMLKGLRSILESHSAATESDIQTSAANVVRRNIDFSVPDIDRLRFKNVQLDSDDVKALWAAKVSTAAFQTMLQSREQLPVHQYKHHVLTGVEHNQVVIICADTGAGKSTQIPSFLLEHELSQGRDCRIVVTQPRRISAISLARRVSRELGEGGNDIGTERSLVGYAIRLESKISQSTRITYATTGVLLRMLESSPDLEQVNCLILDEVHERSMDLDLLFIALRKLQNKRTHLKIVLMSATVDARKFSIYFGGAPIIDIPGRTFPVEVKFLEDAVQETIPLRRGLAGEGHSGRKHIKNPDTSDSESSQNEAGAASKASHDEDLKEYSTITRSFIAEMDEHRIDFELVADVAVTIATKPEYQKYSSAILIFMPGIAEIRRLQAILLARQTFAAHDWIIHLLHSSFSTDDLEKAFIVPPPGQRKIVISTNIAETGVTIPDVTAVIDTCKEKIMRFDERRQVSKLREGFISRSSARQRKGRAARVREGICFHLVTQHRYQNSMLEQHVPEMLRLSLQDAILRIKVWNLGSIEETLAAAIDPPTVKNVRRAISKLKDAGALGSTEELTPLGRQLSKLPLEVVLGKLAIYGIIFKCLDSVLIIIAALSSKSPFQSSRDGNAANHRAAFARGESDLISTLNAYEGWYKAREAGNVHQYCRKHFLNHSSLTAIEDQKVQLLINLVDAGLLALTPDETHRIRTARLGRGNNARRTPDELIPCRFNEYQHDSMLCTIIAVAFYPRILAREGRGWRNIYSNQQMGLASSSITRAAEKPPKWLCYYEATQSKSGTLTVLETSKIPEAALVTVVGGDAVFKFFSGIIDLDNGKLRFSLGDWRQVAAVKAIRERVRDVVQRFLEKRATEISTADEVWMQSWVQLVTGQSLQKT